MKIIKKLLVRLCTIMLLTALLAVGCCAYAGWHMYQEALAEAPLAEKIAALTTAEYHTPLDKLPRFYLDAVVAAEDKRFYTHSGVDPLAICRAAVNDIKAGALVEGGSTITQQLAKNLYFTQEKRFERKFAEIFMAHDIEQLCTKEQILELYVNNIYFGSGYYCIRDAALGFCGKQPAELTESECALLAGLPNAPSAYSPLEHPERAEQRRQQVLNKMIDCNMLTADEAAALPAIVLP